MSEEFDVEICRDLKRLAGIVHKYGWLPNIIDDAQPVGGMVALSGPCLVYDLRPIKLGLPGYYSREEIDKAVLTMYGEPAMVVYKRRKPASTNKNFTFDTGAFRWKD